MLLGVFSPKDTFIIDYSPKRLKHCNISTSSTMMAFTYQFGWSKAFKECELEFELWTYKPSTWYRALHRGQWEKMVIFCWLVKMIGPCDNILLALQFRLLKIVEFSCLWVGMGNNLHTILYVQYTYWVCAELGLMPPTSYVFQPWKFHHIWT